jgi:hypothetical protein
LAYARAVLPQYKDTATQTGQAGRWIRLPKGHLCTRVSYALLLLLWAHLSLASRMSTGLRRPSTSRCGTAGVSSIPPPPPPLARRSTEAPATHRRADHQTKTK